MAAENIAAFFLLYANPVAAISRILDRGRLWFALLAAFSVAILLYTAQAKADFHGLAEASQLEAVGSPVPAPHGPRLWNATRTWAMLPPAGPIVPIGALALAFIPAIIGIRALSGFGSFGVLMRSDYLSLAMCVLLVWAAAYLPVALVTFVFPLLWIHFAAQVFLIIGTALSIRTSMGTSFGYALGITAGAWVVAVLALTVYELLGPMRYYLTSPFLLYYAYALFRSDFGALGDGLRSRQHLRDQLEVATNNPRDADAHYQLGLIYQKRRQLTEAAARFERAVEIDPGEGDAHLQLGRIALAQNRIADAIRSLEAATRIDEKLSLSEGLRDLGIAYFQASRTEDAAAMLTKYADRRPYDPEGLFWLGKTWAALGQNAQAKERFNECIDAVNTSPKHRRPYVKHWASQAKAALKALAA